MATHHAKTLSKMPLTDLLAKVTEKADKPLVMRAAFMLSYHAGLRVQEIAGLEWRKNLFDAQGQPHMEEFPEIKDGQPVRDAEGRTRMRFVPVIFIGSDIGKYGTERTIPMHPDLLNALSALLHSPERDDRFVIPSGRTGASQSLRSRAHALKMRINRMYEALNMEGYSSHSGRRTFITKSARQANLTGNSLRDVQKLAGHRNLVTTEAYIDVSDRQADMVFNLYGAPPQWSIPTT